MPHLHLSLRNEDGEPRSLSTRALEENEALALLCSAEITGSQLVPWGSNYTFAVALEDAIRYEPGQVPREIVGAQLEFTLHAVTGIRTC